MYNPQIDENFIYLQNKYAKWYFNIIKNALGFIQLRKIRGLYVERHHIFPTSLGGPDINENKVFLTAKEHFLCHRLLVKFLIGRDKRKMILAVYGMTHRKNHKQELKITSKVYQTLKEQNSLALSIALKGKIRSAESRLNYSKCQLGRKLSEDHKLKLSKSHKGKKLSEEHKQRLSISGKGTTRPKSMFTDQWRQLQRESHLGRKDSPETLAKKSAAHSGSNNPRAKTWALLLEDNFIIEIKALKTWCKSSNLNFDKLAKTQLTKKFYCGYRVLDKK